MDTLPDQNLVAVRERDQKNVGEVRIRGRLTRCGRPAAGLRVAVTEIVTEGFLDGGLNKPCQTTSTPRLVGSVQTDTDGRFAFQYRPTEADELSCSFTAKVRLQAFEGNLQVWRSLDRTVAANMRFDSEIIPGCTQDRTVIQVIDDQGKGVKGAEIFVNGARKGTSSSNGRAILGGLAEGDLLAARLLIHQNTTGRPNHTIDSQKNWNYRVYLTSVPVLHDANGDNVQLPQQRVADLAAFQVLQVSRNNTLIGFNLTVSVEWAAARGELITIRDRILESSELLYNATDGQFLIERLEIADNARNWTSADVQVSANRSQGSEATADGIAGINGHVRMNPYDSLFYSGAFLHEFAHYIFGVLDEYKQGPDWDPANGPVRCTLAGSGNTAPFGEGFEKEACLSNGGVHNHNLNKFCSRHPANPHVNGTLQGNKDCWTNVVERFSKAPDWFILSPNSRGVIVGRLPDSGVPVGTATTPPPAVISPVMSFIPVLDWKTKWHIRQDVRPDERPLLVARTIHNGAPVDGVRVTLKDRTGRNIYQGTTEALRFLDGKNTGPGEILVHGAHVGDSLHAFKFINPRTLLAGSAIVQAANTTDVVISLQRFEFPLRGIEMVQTPGSLAFTLNGLDAAAQPLPQFVMRFEDAGEPLQFHARRAGENTALLGAILDLKGDQRIELQTTMFDSTGQPNLVRTAAAVFTSLVQKEVRAISYDGRFEVMIPAEALDAPVQIAIEELEFGPLPELIGVERLVAGPYRISSTQGDALQTPGILYINAGDKRFTMGTRDSWGMIELLAYDAQTGYWQPLGHTLDERTMLVTARLTQLGTYVLLERKLG